MQVSPSRAIASKHSSVRHSAMRREQHVVHAEQGVVALLKTRIDIDHVNRLGWTALLEAVILGDGGAAHTEIVRELLAHGANPRVADGQGVAPLAHAEQRGQTAVAELLRRALQAPPARRPAPPG